MTKEYLKGPYCLSGELQKEWDELDPKMKKEIHNNLSRYVSGFTNKLGLETLACVVNDMKEEIEELKGDIDYLMDKLNRND